MTDFGPPPQDDKTRFLLYDVKVQNLVTAGGAKISGKVNENDKIKAMEVFAGTGRPGWALEVTCEWRKIADDNF